MGSMIRTTSISVSDAEHVQIMVTHHEDFTIKLQIKDSGLVNVNVFGDRSLPN